jgi:serine/threonine-protein kinase
MLQSSMAFAQTPASPPATPGPPATAPASAPTPSLDARARADELFDQALADIEKGDFKSACPKFLASYEADPKSSTMLNLGNCYEKNGQTASAWGAFREAERVARNAGKKDWAENAAARAKTLEPRLIRLSVIAPVAPPKDLELRRDQVLLPKGEWSVAIPVDPGEHEISAAAPGHKPWSTKLTATEGAQLRIEVPLLELLPNAPGDTPPPPMAPPAPPPPFWNTPRIAGVAAAGVGVVALGVGAGLGLSANGLYKDAKAQCATGTSGCPASAVTDADSAYSRAGLATGFVIAGGVLAAGGAAVFFLVGPMVDKRTGARVSPYVGAGSLGATGSF